MDEGFRVDLAALTRAADGVNETIRSTTVAPVRDIDPPAAAFGHAGLAASVAGFCDRWDAGVTGLVADAREIAARLARCADAYRRAEVQLGSQLGGMVARTSGMDPTVE